MEKIQITEANKYSTKDIAKWIRQTLKETYKDIKFSVRFEGYAGGSSISVVLLDNQRTRILKKFDEIEAQDVLHVASARNDTEVVAMDWMKNHLASTHHDINQYHIDSDWSFTDEGKKLLIDIMKIVNKYNHDNSDSMTDYFDVNYYVNFSLGTWEKEYKEVE